MLEAFLFFFAHDNAVVFVCFGVATRVRAAEFYFFSASLASEVLLATCCCPPL